VFDEGMGDCGLCLPRGWEAAGEGRCLTRGWEAAGEGRCLPQGWEVVFCACRGDGRLLVMVGA
jgi:hypothetical protein